MSARTAAVTRVGPASLFTCALLACSAQQSSSTTAAGSAAAGAGQGATPAADAGEAGRAGPPATDSGRALAAMGGGGSVASAGTGPAAMRASAAGAAGQPDLRADAGPRDAAEPDAANASAMECSACTSYATPQVSGRVGASQLSALSGLAVSRSQPEIIFAHNDHDRPEVYALDLQGQLHARLTINASVQDIEDIAVGRCADKICVYLADLGDNAAQRDEYSILRFVEPTVPSSPGDAQMSMMFEQLRFRYEDGSHNAESLLVAPNGNLYIITKLAPGSGGSVKATGPSSVYRIVASAFEQSAVAEAQKVATLSVPQPGELALSAAAAHPCGSSLLARTYDRVYEFLVPAGADFEAAFTATPKIVAMPDEQQSEAIDYRADGRGFVTSGEGASAPLMLTQCVP